MIKVEVKNGLVKINILTYFNKDVKNFTKKNAEDLFKIFGIKEGAEVDISVVDIDLMDQTKAFIYDSNGNVIVHSRSYCDSNIFYNSVIFYSKNIENIREVFFEIANKDIDGSLLISNNKIVFQDIYTDEIDLSSVDIEDINYKF